MTPTIIILFCMFVLMGVVAVLMQRTIRRLEHDFTGLIEEEILASITPLDVFAIQMKASSAEVWGYSSHTAQCVVSYAFDPNDEDTRAYAIRCAEELCDKLNESI